MSLYFKYSCGNDPLDAIGRLMADNGASKAFLRFCISEWSVENYLAFLCAANYRKWPTNNKLQAYMLAFCSPQSPMELNVDRGAVNRLNSLMRNATAGRRPPSSALDEIDKTVRVNLADTYSRFRYQYDQGAVGIWKPDAWKKMKTQSSNGDDAKEVVRLLRWGGYPVNHFGLYDYTYRKTLVG